MQAKRSDNPLTAAWYEQRIASSVADYNASQEETTHIGELRGLAEGLVRRLTELEAVQPTKAQRETAGYLCAVLGERQPDGVVSACRGEQEFFIRPNGSLESGITHLAVGEFDGLPHHVRGTGVQQAPPSGDDELTTVIDRGEPEETFAIPEPRAALAAWLRSLPAGACLRCGTRERLPDGAGCRRCAEGGHRQTGRKAD